MRGDGRYETCSLFQYVMNTEPSPMPNDVPNQSRFYELQGSLSRTPSVSDWRVSDSREKTARRAEARKRTGRGLPVWLRVTLVVAAVLLLAVGVAGLFLPGLQGILTILLGLALLSLVSRRTHWALRWSLSRWPRLRKRVERIRWRSRSWLHRKVGRQRRRSCAETAPRTQAAESRTKRARRSPRRASSSRAWVAAGRRVRCCRAPVDPRVSGRAASPATGRSIPAAARGRT